MTNYNELLHQEIAPALGCTEPIAVAYAAACASGTLGHPVEAIRVEASCNILKNAMGVGIPGTDMAGLPVAAALGALGGQADAGLEVLRGCTEATAARAKRMVADGLVTVRQKQTAEPLYVQVQVKGGGHEAMAVLQRRHTNLTELRLDGEIVMRQDLDEQAASVAGAEQETSVDGIWAYCMEAPVEDLAFLQEGIDMDLRAAEEGFAGRHGMAVGYNLAASGTKGHVMSSDIGTSAIATTAAACDARMAGADVPVMSVAGSGNQGLVSTVPVAVFAQKLESGREKMLRAVALSDLITVHIKRGIGRLSALCGCGIAAAVGASCGITYLLGGELTQVRFAIQNMVANITGIVCDGAKSGCAVKVATAVGAAVQCAVLATNDVHAPAIDGIVEADVEKSIRNLCAVGRQGMAPADQLILDMMCRKTV